MDITPNAKYYIFLKPIYSFFRFRLPFKWYFNYIWDPIKTRINIIRNRAKDERFLEIGSDFRYPIKGFETLSIEGCVNIDYVMDASQKLPFSDNTFKLIYASHVLEHIPWYQTVTVLKEWKRILVRGGEIEIWVPDGLKICRSLLSFEEDGKDNSCLDGYYHLVPNKDPRLWASLRIFTFGDSSGDVHHANWHRALFTPSLLLDSLRWAGFEKVSLLGNESVRGKDHGWINLGAKGVKP